MSEHVSPAHPLLWAMLRPVNNDCVGLRRALAKLSEEDAAFVVDDEEIDEQVVIRVLSETQLENICERLARKHSVYVESEPPKIIYLETIRNTSAAEGKFISQSGERGFYGHVVIRIEPNPTQGYEFVNEAPEDVIPGRFLKSIDRGIRYALKSENPHPEVTDIRVVLCDGSYHKDDSNEAAFESAGFMATKQAMGESSVVILEPIISLQVVVRYELTNSVVADLKSRRAEITGIETEGEKKVIHAIVRLAEIIGYADELRSMTEETATYSAELLRYRPAQDLPSSGDDSIGVTANKPRKPKPKSGAAAIEPPWPEPNC